MSWLFLQKHKLELMFSSIEPCEPLGRIFPATSFPLFVSQTKTHIPHYFYWPMKRQLACVLRLPANQLRTVFSCLCTRSQSIFFCNSVKLLDRAFISHPPSTFLSYLYCCHSYRALFRRPLVYICSIYDVIPGTSIVNTERFPFVITF